MESDDELKKLFIYRYKKMFMGHLRFLENAIERGAVDEEYINNYKSLYNKIVYDGAREAYIQHKFKQAKQALKVKYKDDLFSAEI
jgi:hypothetical protein